MSLLNLVGAVAHAKWNALTAGGEAHKPTLTPAPLGLHQGSVVEIPRMELAMAKTDGAIMKPVSPASQTVVAVGTTSLFGRNVVRSWLSDGLSFIQTVVALDATKADEAILFTSFDEIALGSNEDAEFWLGKYKRDPAGEYARGPDGLGVIEEYGLIGWPKFEAQGAVFQREWTPVPAGGSEFGIEPVEFTETLTMTDGSVTTMGYQSVSYSRMIGEAPQTREILLAGYVEISRGGVQAAPPTINLFVGVAIDPASLKVLKAAA